MACENRMLNIRAGLATIAPINILTHLFTAEEAELKICGLAKVEVEILKKHTIYQVGLNQTDQHIQVKNLPLLTSQNNTHYIYCEISKETISRRVFFAQNGFFLCKL